MPASSKAQQQFFGLVRAVQKGEVPASKVTSNVRDAAKYTSDADVEDMASTKTKDLPDRVISKDDGEGGGEDKEKQDEGLTFGEIVGRYNEYGRVLKREHSLSELAQQLSDIAEYAEYTLTNEQDDWFDAHTVRRNIKEMKAYAKEFAKIAQEADSYNARMSALYDDMGRVLERYFEIYETNEGGDMDMVDEYTHQPEDRAPAQTLTTPAEEKAKKGVFDEKQLTERAIAYVRERLRGPSLIRFDELSEDEKVRVAWRAMGR
jgi:hypothetical protein